jgi:hypothetical protein
LIHLDDVLHTTDKFHYLVQSMTVGSRAEDLVKSYPATEENYPKAIEALKERFGKPDLLVEVHVRELTNLVINAKTEKPSLSKLYDKLETQLRALESLGVKPEHTTQFLFPMIESCLPEDILIAWQRSPLYGLDGARFVQPKSKLDMLMDFIKQEVASELKRTLARGGLEESKQKNHGKGKNQSFVTNYQKKSSDDIPTAASLVSNSQPEGCIFCEKSNHISPDCYKARSMTIAEKNTKIKEKRACFKCLKSGHHANQCKSKYRCIFCNRSHCPIMCPEAEQKRVVNTETAESGPAMSSVTLSQANSNQVSHPKQVLMKTLHVRVQGTTGEVFEVRLLFDEGSQRSCIKTSIAEKLKCKSLGNLTFRNALFGGIVSELKNRNYFQVEVAGIDGKEKRSLKLLNEDVICGACPSVPYGPWISELVQKKIRLTDTWNDTPEVQILIGSDLWGSLMTGRMVKLKSGLVAVESVFGWTLSGELPTDTQEPSHALTLISMMTREQTCLSELWKLETIGIQDPAEKITQEEHDQKVKEDFQSKISRDSDGRYVVRLPWINDSIPIPTNHAVSEKRLIAATCYALP